MSKIVLKGYLSETSNDELFKFTSNSLVKYASDNDEYIIPEYTPISNQKSIGSCVANSIADAFEIMSGLKDPNNVKQFSRMFVYYNARRYHNATNEDSGTYISAGLKSLVKYGICLESTCKYDVKNVFKQPSILAYKEADDNEFKAGAFYQIKSRGNDMLNDIESAIRSNHPVVFGVKVGDDYMNYNGEDKVFEYPEGNGGGHAQILVGVKGVGDKKCFLVRNSWGASWGLKKYPGHAWISGEYAKQSNEAFVVTLAKDLLV